eukprot:gnl/Carplike_NY0171/1557_a2112_777.p1 GENE.gnl/Carplike_NY0171/1557_a2112_777~~gnl/Carplike_NY0171/1557_a2112_777.p1  ORF type:complete len:643 (+),score=120.09 gnl/Carplike_NY0171/1557_a2112_777:184-1929(+)
MEAESQETSSDKPIKELFDVTMTKEKLRKICDSLGFSVCETDQEIKKIENLLTFPGSFDDTFNPSKGKFPFSLHYDPSQETSYIEQNNTNSGHLSFSHFIITVSKKMPSIDGLKPESKKRGGFFSRLFSRSQPEQSCDVSETIGEEYSEEEYIYSVLDTKPPPKLCSLDCEEEAIKALASSFDSSIRSVEEKLKDEMEKAKTILLDDNRLVYDKASITSLFDATMKIQRRIIEPKIIAHPIEISEPKIEEAPVEQPKLAEEMETHAPQEYQFPVSPPSKSVSSPTSESLSSKALDKDGIVSPVSSDPIISKHIEKPAKESSIVESKGVEEGKKEEEEEEKEKTGEEQTKKDVVSHPISLGIIRKKWDIILGDQFIPEKYKKLLLPSTKPVRINEPKQFDHLFDSYRKQVISPFPLPPRNIEKKCRHFINDGYSLTIKQTLDVPKRYKPAPRSSLKPLLFALAIILVAISFGVVFMMYGEEHLLWKTGERQPSKNYYGLFGVEKTATSKEISSAFRKLSRKFHPDLNPDCPDCEEKFKELEEAKDVLTDIYRRTYYDDYGTDMPPDLYRKLIKQAEVYKDNY